MIARLFYEICVAYMFYMTYFCARISLYFKVLFIPYFCLNIVNWINQKSKKPVVCRANYNVISKAETATPYMYHSFFYLKKHWTDKIRKTIWDFLPFHLYINYKRLVV